MDHKPILKGKSKWGLFSSKTAEDKYKQLVPIPSSDQDSLLRKLREELQQKEMKIELLSSQYQSLSISQYSPSKRSSIILQRKHHLLTDMYLITDEGSERAPVATRGSVMTTNVLRALPDQQPTTSSLLAEKFIAAFKKPLEYVNYLQSKEFANDLIEISYAICDIFEEEPRCHYLQSPVYVIGDIHGNLEDLHFFSDNLWSLGMDVSAGKFLFLGDYVDRGMNCLECVAYLFALKVLSPSKIFLLRFRLSIYFSHLYQEEIMKRGV